MRERGEYAERQSRITMAQPNAAREPSMDEILASIRRIIESNEPATEARLAALGDLDGFQSEAANDDMEDVPLTVDGSFDAYEGSTHGHEPAQAAMTAPSDYRAPQLVAANEAAPAKQQAPESKSLSLADVAARVRAASERGAPLREAPVAIHPQPAPVVEPLAYASPIAVTAAEPETEDDAAMTSELSEEAPGEHRDEADKDDAPLAAIASLVSTVTVEKVARSFQDLQSALVEAERRSLDEIAEDMLRPMLQEWLDDNLPTLVERLVREEIERVVRGPRR
jgi:cell pole-organizing protein PopZ